MLTASTALHPADFRCSLNTIATTFSRINSLLYDVAAIALVNGSRSPSPLAQESGREPWMSVVGESELLVDRLLVEVHP